MEFKAYKMDGLGNDFIIIDNRDKDIKMSKSGAYVVEYDK